MRLQSSLTARTARRAGFTLIELLIVMALIGVLASLTIGAVFKLREAQMKNFTETTVQKLASALEQQWKAAIDQIKEDAPPDPVARSPLGLAQPTIGDVAVYDTRRSRVIFKKLRLRGEFPTTFAEALAPSAGFYGTPVKPKPTYVTALAGVNPNAVPPDMQAAVLLFLALGQSRRGMAAFKAEELVEPTAITTVSLQLTGSGGTKDFRIFKDS